jgi:hypothetical protein
MNIRLAHDRDLDAVRELHALYFSDKFEFPDLTHFLCLMVVEDDNGKIITFGGVRTILEAVAITDMSSSARIRREALYKLLQGSIFTANAHKYIEIHCFIQQSVGWFKHLIKVGFKQCKGTALNFRW